MKISWDDRKAETNLKKHQVSLEEAVTVVLNPLSLYAPNQHPSGDRWEYLGHSFAGRVLYVVTVEVTDEAIQIISARKAEPHERETYEKGL